MRHLIFVSLALIGGTLPVHAEVVSFSQSSADFHLIEPGSRRSVDVLPAPENQAALTETTVEIVAASLAPAWMDSRFLAAKRECRRMRAVFPGASRASALRRERFRAIVESAACEAGIPVDLLDALIMQESRYKADARSHAGAIGLAQLMPGTARDLGVRNPRDPGDNVRGGARYLRMQYETFGSIPLALAAYNAGPGAVRQHKGVPPYRETRGYVRTITSSLTAFPVRSRRFANIVTLQQDTAHDR